MKTVIAGRSYTEAELWLALRQERLELTRERAEAAKQIAELTRRQLKIDERLGDLDRAEVILEGGLD
ncbi:hypothetical protein JRC04_04555 [Mycolicibacterium sp. S2-37]|uniref:hypothetical protein n=1 Tax=Mycolicibacterium sp. S2-37 TaxID=2810297 RepID=UPI001A93D2AA|nr:hypothetical protein [Mycolicibacterium sp. S2-37]MBO0676729.1 hypothetical protein [Mycolicibacterium sp. S2-37]